MDRGIFIEEIISICIKMFHHRIKEITENNFALIFFPLRQWLQNLSWHASLQKAKKKVHVPNPKTLIIN